MLTLLSAAFILGLSAGFSPGPLTTLVLTQTLRHGTKEGLKVSLAPFFTNIPIILLSAFILTKLANFRSILGVISLIGGLFVLYLAYKSFRTRGIAKANPIDKPQSFSKGIIVNFLSPNPYLFWITVGGPTMVKGWAEYQLAAVLFVIVFWICLVGSKMFMAVLTGTSRHRISGRPYLYLMRILGLLLVFYALLLMKDGLGLLSIF